MTHPAGLLAWGEEVSTRLPVLNRGLAWGLTLWSFGMVCSQSCGITTVSTFLALLLGQKSNSVRQRLREWCYDQEDKRGQGRSELVVQDCFAPLLGWVLSWWVSKEPRLALALDATTLRQCLTVLVVSVVYRGCAIPVAWVVLPACQAAAWRPHWQALLQRLAPAVPADWQVIVLADRGLYARWLYQAILAQGWHPFLRITQQGLFRPARGAWRALATAAPQPGFQGAGEVTCFATPRAQLACTLLVRWEAPHQAAWLIVTDLAPHQADALWYGMRSWIEAALKDIKRGGWHWEQTKMSDPARASRLWLALAVATLWVVSVGGAAQTDLCPSSFDALPRPRRTRPRLLGCFRLGVLCLLAALLRAQPLPLTRLLPDPWPDPLDHAYDSFAFPLSTYP